MFARQQKLGIIPSGTKLAPRNSNIKAWDSLGADEKRLYTHFMEVYAAFFSYTDYEVGRVINYLKEIGQLDNTLVAVIIGDNGASKEGTDIGTSIGLNVLYQGQQKLERLVGQYDSLGTEYTAPNYPLGWALAANAPFRYWKSDANSEGGTHNPLILFYPKGIKEKGGIRTQYSHVIDILPTTIELAGSKIPEVINGYKQEPVQGVSLAYSINNPKAPSKHKQQYYEIMGSRSFYKDGWKAGAFHVTGSDFDKDQWELYNLNEDWTETSDLAVKNPEKLEDLKALFDSEAKKYNVYPLKDRLASSARFAGVDKVTKSYVLYPGATQFWAPSSPRLTNGSFSITAETHIPASGAEGVLLANGGRFGGISLFVKNSKLHFAFTDGYQKQELISDKTIAAGPNTLKLNINGGLIKLFINDSEVASSSIQSRNGILYYTYDEGLDVGKDSNTPVNENYKVPFAFNGTINKIVIETK